MGQLAGKIAVVTGASRGAGRGIALVLGSQGATVYVTGRSVRGHATQPDLSGTTVDETAELVTQRGGKGIPIRVDHSVDAEVEALFEQIQREQGRLDILVNNAWGGYEIHGGSFDDVFWKQPIERWDKMFTVGLRSHLVATRTALPLLFPQRQGLIINTTLEMDTTFYDMALFYRTAKVAINYMTFGMAHDLHQRAGYNIAVVGVAPGWMRTEGVMQNFQQGLHPATELTLTESVEYIGRAVVALATDPQIMQRSGGTFRTRDLAREYGFTDIDGKQPE